MPISNSMRSPPGEPDETRDAHPGPRMGAVAAWAQGTRRSSRRLTTGPRSRPAGPAPGGTGHAPRSSGTTGRSSPVHARRASPPERVLSGVRRHRATLAARRGSNTLSSSRVLADLRADGRPRVLVVPEEGRFVVREDPPVSPTHHDLGVHRVPEAAEDRPLRAAPVASRHPPRRTGTPPPRWLAPPPGRRPPAARGGAADTPADRGSGRATEGSAPPAPSRLSSLTT